MDREPFERQSGKVRDRQLKLRDEAAKALSNQRREQMRADALVLYKAQQIIGRSYGPWWSDRGVGKAARSGDGSGPPPDLGKFLRDPL